MSHSLKLARSSFHILDVCLLIHHSKSKGLFSGALLQKRLIILRSLLVNLIARGDFWECLSHSLQLQGGEDPQGALSVHVFFRKREI